VAKSAEGLTLEAATELVLQENPKLEREYAQEVR
jgi:hypothetical protein